MCKLENGSLLVWKDAEDDDGGGGSKPAEECAVPPSERKWSSSDAAVAAAARECNELLQNDGKRDESVGGGEK